MVARKRVQGLGFGVEGSKHVKVQKLGVNAYALLAQALGHTAHGGNLARHCSPYCVVPIAISSIGAT